MFRRTILLLYTFQFHCERCTPFKTISLCPMNSSLVGQTTSGLMNVVQVGQSRSRKKCHPWRRPGSVTVYLVVMVKPPGIELLASPKGEFLAARGLPVVLRWYVCGRDCEAWFLMGGHNMQSSWSSKRHFILLQGGEGHRM